MSFAVMMPSFQSSNLGTLRKRVVKPLAERRLHLRQMANKEVIRVGNEFQALWFRDFRNHTAELGRRGILVAISAEEELWKCASGQERIGVIAALGVGGQAKRRKAVDPRIAAARFQAHGGAERES
jgi:hypothetical protein